MPIQQIKSGVIADDAVTAAKLDDSTSQLFGFRNRIINGDMRIAQRATSANVSSGFVAVDRWSTDWSLNGAMTVERSTDAPPGFSYSLKSTVVTSSTDSMVGTSEYYAYRQPIEGFNINDLQYGTANAKPLTLSFWVKSSTAATYSAGFRAELSSSTSGNHRSFTINSADTWEYKTLTFNGSTTATLTNADTNSKAMELFITFTNGSNLDDTTNDGNWDTGNYIGLSSDTGGDIGNFGALAAGQYIAITGVQLEVGSVATPFERRPYGTELALCQRYYYRNTAVDDALTVFGNALTTGATGAFANINLPVSMRAQPTITFNALCVEDLGGRRAISSFSGNRSNQNLLVGDVVTASGLTSARYGVVQADNSTAAWIAASAEI